MSTIPASDLCFGWHHPVKSQANGLPMPPVNSKPLSRAAHRAGMERDYRAKMNRLLRENDPEKYFGACCDTYMETGHHETVCCHYSKAAKKGAEETKGSGDKGGYVTSDSEQEGSLLPDRHVTEDEMEEFQRFIEELGKEESRIKELANLVINGYRKQLVFGERLEGEDDDDFQDPTEKLADKLNAFMENTVDEAVEINRDELLKQKLYKQTPFVHPKAPGKLS